MEGVKVFGPGCFSLRPDREKVFRWLGLDRDLPCRRAFERAWTEAAASIAECAAPQAATARGDDGSMTVFLTLGPGPEERMAALFRRREYVAGSLLNALCDDALFQLDRQAAPLIGEALRSEHVFAGARLEPGAGLAVAAQREKLRPFRKALPFARISETGVLYPTKSMMFVLTVSDRPCRLSALHDCAACGRTDCLYREPPAQGHDRLTHDQEGYPL